MVSPISRSVRYAARKAGRCKHLTLTLLILLQTGFAIESRAASDLTLPDKLASARARDYAVAPNHFRDYYLRTYSITDIPVGLEGEWSDAEVNRLAELLKEVDRTRPRRAASIREWSFLTSLKFRIGEAFEHSVEKEHFPNPAAFWGSGVSGYITHSFRVPMTASDDEIMAMLKPHLPDVLKRDPKVREEWQAEVASMLRGQPSLCAKLFGRFFRR